MRFRVVVPFLFALLAGCGSPVVEAAPVVPAVASPAPVVSAAPDQAAPLTITEDQVLTASEAMYAMTCDDWAMHRMGLAVTIGKLADSAAASQHPGLAKAVDLLVSFPTAGRMEMERMCKDVHV